MTSFWNLVQPKVWAYNGECDECYDAVGDYSSCGCCTPPNYGPHIKQVRDLTGHRAVDVPFLKENGRMWVARECECGWRDFPTNWYDHLDALDLPMKVVLS